MFRAAPAFLWKSQIPYHSQQASTALGPSDDETFSKEAGMVVSLKVDCKTYNYIACAFVMKLSPRLSGKIHFHYEVQRHPGF